MHKPLVILSFSAATAISASASAQFSVQYLGQFGPAVTYRMNSSGQIAGDKQINSMTTAIRYTPGAEGVVARTIPAGSGMSFAVGINDAGACIGMISPDRGPSYAAIWDANNVLTPLAMPRGTWTYNTGTDINDANVACGYVTLALVGPDQQTGWRWTAANGYAMLPHLNGGNYAFARDINATGSICGYAGATEDDLMHAVVWDANNQLTDLGVPADASDSFAQAINNAGVVVGTTSNGRPWKYVPGTGMVSLPRYGNQPAFAMGVNNSGWVVGIAHNFGEPQTVVWDPSGTLHNIGENIVGDFYFPSDESIPLAINDNNDLVVRAYDFANACCDPVAVRLHFGFPVPCPADIDDNGSVNTDDLLLVIGAWGPCVNPNNCPADIDGSGLVNTDDLLLIVGGWGACP